MTENYLLERRSLRQAFDQAARSYDHVAFLQRDVARHLLGRLHLASPPQRILDLGCGTGHGSGLLAVRFPAAGLLLADLSLAMVNNARAAHRAAHAVCADAQALPLKSESIDLLWSNLMLQWCNNSPLAFAQFHASLRPGGCVAFSTFGPATLQELKESFEDGYTHVSKFTSACDIALQLQAAGFTGVRLETERCVLYYADVFALTRELKALGANNATQGRSRGLTGRRSWQRMLARYEILRMAQGLPATYELIYVTALKPGKES